MSGPSKRAREDEVGAAACAARAPPAPRSRRHRSAALLMLMARRRYYEWPFGTRPLLDCLRVADTRALEAAFAPRRRRTALLLLMARRCYKTWPMRSCPLLDCLSLEDARALVAAFVADAPTLMDVAWIVAKCGYAADVWRCSGACRELWRWIAPALSDKDAVRVRRDHPFWQAIINLPHGPRGETRLMLAARHGMLAPVETLIAWHADVNAVDLFGGTALIEVITGGSCRVELVRALLDAGAGASIDAVPTSSGITALVDASSRGYVEVVRTLIAAGAVVDRVMQRGWTALITASYFGHVDIVRSLLAAGADKSIAAPQYGTALVVAGRGVGVHNSKPATIAAIRALLAP